MFWSYKKTDMATNLNFAHKTKSLDIKYRPVELSILISEVLEIENIKSSKVTAVPSFGTPTR